MNEPTPRPEVSGLSPSEGPPGTRIIIRGHNLGKDSKDLVSVTVCNFDCTKTAQWISPGKIIATIDNIYEKNDISGPIIVTTKSGGEGICTVNFTLSFSRLKALTVSSVWIEEDCLGLLPGHQGNLLSDAKEVICEPDPLGILFPNTYSSGPKINHESLTGFSSKLVDPSFNPIRFLLDRHSETSWDALMRGHKELSNSLDINSKDDAESSSSYITKNVAVVINVLSDMRKLSRTLESHPPKISDELRNTIHSLNGDISLHVSQLINLYSKMCSFTNFLSSFKPLSSTLRIPTLIRQCLKEKNKFSNILSSGRDLVKKTDNPSHLDPLIDEVYSRLNNFNNLVIENLHFLLPVRPPLLVEFLKEIQCFDPSDDYLVPLLNSHLSWVSAEIENMKTIFNSNIKNCQFFKEQIISRDYLLDRFCQDILILTINFCNFFTKEFNVTETLVEYRSSEWRKDIKMKLKRTKILSHLAAIDKIIDRILLLFIDSLRLILLTPWSVNELETITHHELYCSITLFNNHQISQAFTAINSVVSLILQLSTSNFYFLTESLDSKDSFTFSFLTHFNHTFSSLFFDNLLTLRRYYATLTFHYLSFDKIQNFNPLYVSFLQNPSVQIYTLIHEWFSVLKEIFNHLNFEGPYKIKSSKFESTFIKTFLLNVYKEKIDEVISSPFLHPIPLIESYNFLETSRFKLEEQFSSSLFFSSEWKNFPISPDKIKAALLSQLAVIDQEMIDSLLYHVLKLCFHPLTSLLDKNNLQPSNPSPSHVIPTLLHCLIKLCSFCKDFEKKIFNKIIKETFKHLSSNFSKYITQNLNLQMKQRLYEDILAFQECGRSVSYQIETAELNDMLEAIKDGVSIEDASNYAKKTTLKWKNTLEMLKQY